MPVGSQPKNFGVPTMGRVGHSDTRFTAVPLLWTFQLVAQRASSYGAEKGRPVFQRKMLETCQPPRTVSKARLMLWPNHLPRPKGSWMTELMLTRCCMSKSEVA